MRTRSKIHRESLFMGFNRLYGNLTLFDIFWLKENRQLREDSKIVILGQQYFGVSRGAVKNLIVFPAAAADGHTQCTGTRTLPDRALDIKQC